MSSLHDIGAVVLIFLLFAVPVNYGFMSDWVRGPRTDRGLWLAAGVLTLIEVALLVAVITTLN